MDLMYVSRGVFFVAHLGSESVSWGFELNYLDSCVKPEKTPFMNV